MIIVYKLPEKLTDGFCFGGGRPIVFLNVDWFEGEGATREDVELFIKTKNYFKSARSFSS